jgi:regulator of protease activity HflC (stomatin/prohibitin superfamily)
MAEITNLGPFRHLRADATSHILHYRGARLLQQGRGLAFWFSPWNASVAEVPIDDREVALAFHGRSADFQDLVVQGVVGFRILEPARTAERVDFAIHLGSGAWLRQPLEKISGLLGQLAQQHTQLLLQAAPLREILAQGPERIRQSVEQAVAAAPLLTEMGLEVVAVRLSALRPSSDLERALEAPIRERIQEESDQAAFRRRALAVEKERAIQENELQNQIELARREEQLIEQRGQNARRDATEKAEAARIESESAAAGIRVQAAAQAESVRAIDGARVAVERERLEGCRSVPPAVLAALAAQELAGKLTSIEHLNITPDLLGPLLSGLVAAGTRRLDAGRE